MTAGTSGAPDPAMKAARVHRFGGPDAIEIDDIEIPTPGEDQVLVDIHAAGVGPWDGWIRSGKSVLPQPLPLTLGSDFSGVVRSAAHGFQVGDEVFGVTSAQFTGAYAEQAAVPVARIARKPRRLGHVEAASVPVVAVTAHQMLFDHARVARGERVAIVGAAGNVGAYAVQLAHAAGARVIGVIRRGDADYVRRLGADEVVERTEDLAPVDAVIDAVGGDVRDRAMAALVRGGRLISAVAAPDAERAARLGVTAAFMLVDVRTEALARIAMLIDEGRLVTNVGTTLPLADARVAHEMLGGTRPHRGGKIVLAVR